uniref:hypothetical protein n=1 Tax=Caballeronia choica TaxID=326476 RepID=UPI0035B56E9D
MNAIVPWAELRGVVEPQYPRAAMAVRRLSREFILGGRRRFGVGAVVVMTSDSNNPPWQLPGMRNAEQLHDELKRAAVVAFPLNESAHESEEFIRDSHSRRVFGLFERAITDHRGRVRDVWRELRRARRQCHTRFHASMQWPQQMRIRAEHETYQRPGALLPQRSPRRLALH